MALGLVDCKGWNLFPLVQRLYNHMTYIEYQEKYIPGGS